MPKILKPRPTKMYRPTLAKSLGGQGGPYIYAQVRLANGSLRVQWPLSTTNPNEMHEDTHVISKKLAVWIAAQPATWPSLANTDAMYVPAQVRVESTQSIRLQVPGTSYNRPYGAVFLLTCANCSNRAAWAAKSAKTEEDWAKIPFPVKLPHPGSCGDPTCKTCNPPEEDGAEAKPGVLSCGDPECADCNPPNPKPGVKVPKYKPGDWVVTKSDVPIVGGFIGKVLTVVGGIYTVWFSGWQGGWSAIDPQTQKKVTGCWALAEDALVDIHVPACQECGGVMCEHMMGSLKEQQK